MEFTLTETEVRVLGALIEKDITTPEYYPLSLNALVLPGIAATMSSPSRGRGSHPLRQATERHDCKSWISQRS